MCGIAGILNVGRSNSDLRSLVHGFLARLRYRGPDNGGVWLESDGRVALGHRRLSVVDPSPGGRPPMRSACGRYVLAFNGEIYNHAALRRECGETSRARGVEWRGRSDAEVALEAIATWGLREALRRFNGTFALALWDRNERTLHLARDRIGEKPLYYGWVGDAFLFASELRALRAYPRWQPEVDRGSLADFLGYGYIAAPGTIFKGVSKLLPGSVLTVDARPAAGPSRPERYWSLEQALAAATDTPFHGDAGDAADELETLLRDSVRLRMEAGVPLGAFLSGGIDSSVIVALMQSQSDRPVDTFSIGFEDPAYDEAPFAAGVAAHLGTRHHAMYVAPEEVIAVVPRLGSIFDEPFGDSSQVPSSLLASLTRQHVTVALSGDGGDELFAGYTRYDATQRLWKMIGRVPAPARSVLGGLLARAPVDVLDRVFAGAGPLLNRFGRPGAVGDKVKKVADLLRASSPDSLYRSILSTWPVSAPPVLGAEESPEQPRRTAWWEGIPLPFLKRMMLYDLSYYLPDDILTKVDRVTMNVGLEARVPLLDHRIVEFALRIPQEISRHDGRGKWPLRRVLGKYVPEHLTDRPKRGFGVPLGTWLRGPLRSWAEELIDESRLRREGYLDPEPIRLRWKEHLSGSRNWQHSLWNVLMFQAWLEQHERAS